MVNTILKLFKVGLIFCLLEGFFCCPDDSNILCITEPIITAEEYGFLGFEKTTR